MFVTCLVWHLVHRARVGVKGVKGRSKELLGLHELNMERGDLLKQLENSGEEFLE